MALWFGNIFGHSLSMTRFVANEWLKHHHNHRSVMRPPRKESHARILQRPWGVACCPGRGCCRRLRRMAPRLVVQAAGHRLPAERQRQLAAVPGRPDLTGAGPDPGLRRCRRRRAKGTAQEHLLRRLLEHRAGARGPFAGQRAYLQLIFEEQLEPNPNLKERTMRTSIRNLIVAASVVGALVTVSACSSSDTSVNNDQKATDTQLQKYQANQPVPQADWSQYRQTIIDVEQAQIHGQTTTTFEFNQGVADPVMVCPSIGFPVPSTSQLTNPDQIAWVNGSASQTIAQAEANGAYTGNSTGTYIVCVAPNGTKYVDYWEGFVKTVGGPAHWDTSKKSVVLDGAPTVVAKTNGK